MKKKFAITLLTVLACFHLQAQDGVFTIQGTIHGTTPHHLLMLLDATNGSFRVDTLTINQGTFTYQGRCNQREERLLMLNDSVETNKIRRASQGKRMAMYGSFIFTLFVHPDAHITLNGNASEFPFLTLSDPGNPINEQRNEVLWTGKEEQLKINRLHYQANEAYWRNDTTQTKETERQIKMLQGNIQAKQQLWIEQHPDKEYAACLYCRTGLLSDKAEAIEAQYKQFTPAVQQTVYGEEIKAKLEQMKAIVPGAVAPAFTLRNVKDGKDVSLKDYKGKYIILDFWGSWCGPCRKSHPHLLKIYQQYKEKGLVIIGIAADRKDETILKAAGDDGLLWPQLNMYEQRSGQTAINKLYNVTAFPTKILINPQGTIEAIYVGDTNKLDEQLQQLL